jgi:hypothetical protein
MKEYLKYDLLYSQYITIIIFFFKVLQSVEIRQFSFLSNFENFLVINMNLGKIFNPTTQENQIKIKVCNKKSIMTISRISKFQISRFNRQFREEFVENNGKNLSKQIISE